MKGLLKLKLQGKRDFVIPHISKIFDTYPDMDLIEVEHTSTIIFTYKDYYIIPYSFHITSEISYSKDLKEAIMKNKNDIFDTTLEEFMSWAK